MRIQKQKYGAVTVFKPAGPITEADVEQFKTGLLQTIQEALGRAVLDASAVPFVDSKGLEALVDVTNEVAHGGQLLKLCAVNKTLREVLALTGLSSQFEHFEDANSAVRSFL